MKFLLKRLASVVLLGALLVTIIPAPTSAQTLPAGCAPGAMYSSTTGQPCTSTTDNGCPPGAMYNVNTGQPCANTPTQSVALVEAISIPVLKLQYDSNRKESALAYSASITIKNTAANGSSISLGKKGYISMYLTNVLDQGSTYVSASYTSPTVVTGDTEDSYYIPSGASRSFSLSGTASTKQLAVTLCNIRLLLGRINQLL
jgi:hypothetical protein